MKTQHSEIPQTRSHTLLRQDRINSCTWIGQGVSDSDEHFAGQTFVCPRSGELDRIQLFLSDVRSNGDLLVSLHEFNPTNQSWGPALAIGRRLVSPQLGNSWVDFLLDPTRVEAGQAYGFKLAAPDLLVALAEAVEDHQHPFAFGQEWNADTRDQQGRFYQYFSLAFQVGMRA
ncbi:MAG: hypothetical protein ACK4E0_09115 [Chitinophagaceae bacterium]